MNNPRLPSSEQWIRWAAGRLRMDVEVFIERCDVFALEAGLGMARSTPKRRDEREQAARMLATVLRWQARVPPFEPKRRKLAVESLEMCAEYCGYRLILRRSQRAELCRRAGSGRSTHAEIASWLKPRLRQLRPVEAARVRLALTEELGPAPAERPDIVISQPSTLIDPADRELLNAKVADARLACQRAVERMLGGRPPARAADSWLGPLAVHAPTCDHHWEDDQAESCRKNLPVFQAASALVILGFGGGSHSTGFEHASVPRSAPVLYIGWKERGLEGKLPHAIAGHFGARSAEVKWIESFAEIPLVVSDFVCRKWSQILNSWHSTNLRQFVYGPTARRMAKRLEACDPGQLEALLMRWGFTSEGVSLLTTPSGLATLGDEEIMQVMAAIGLSGESPANGPKRIRLADFQLDALAAFQEEYEVPAHEINKLRVAAERELQLATTLQSMGDIRSWLHFRQRLRDRGEL